METNKQKVIIPQNIITAKQIEKTKKTAILIRNRSKSFLFEKKSDKKTLIIIATILFLFAAYRGISLFQTIYKLNNDPYVLEKVQQYNINNLKTNQLTRNNTISATTIYDLIENNENIKAETQRYDKYKENLLFPYTYFLQYVLLPKLNIRKELYTDELKTDLLGKAFLEENPYNDTNLFQKRSNFFSSTNQNEINQIKDISISDINEYDNGIFGIKINFGFTSPSKNALLFLTDKITTTSDQENISLLGEFFYYLRQQIKADKQTEITQRQTNGIFSGETNIDKIIGYNIYNRVFNGEDNNIIDNTTINRTIFTMMGCSPETEKQCFYKFRDKYRRITGIAYSIGLENNINKTEELRKFIKELPPIIAINNFVYNKIGESGIIKKTSNKYQGEISLEIYGQSISQEDKDDIAKVLGKQCFGDERIISPEEAINTINEDIVKKSNIIDENQNKSNSIRDLKTTIENINTEFESLDNYKKTIRLFEIYRMLNENGLCKTI